MSDDKRIENSQSPSLQDLVIKHMTTAHIAEALLPNAAAPSPAASEPAPAAADTPSPQPDAK